MLIECGNLEELASLLGESPPDAKLAVLTVRV